jgi:hypothetical protein
LVEHNGASWEASSHDKVLAIDPIGRDLDRGSASRIIALIDLANNDYTHIIDTTAYFMYK